VRLGLLLEVLHQRFDRLPDLAKVGEHVVPVSNV
jgi:hypothetical protein